MDDTNSQPQLPAKSQRAFDQLLAMKPEERLEIFALFCRGCGFVQPDGGQCHCQNDE